MNEKTAKYISIVSVLLIIILSALLLLNSNFGYKFKYTSRGALILSNFKDPVSYIEELRNNDDFIVITSFMENSEVNPIMGAGMTTLLSVLAGNKKNTTNIQKLLAADGTLQSCHTNYGDIKTVEQLSKDECDIYINSQTESVRIILSPVTASLPNSQIILSENEMLIKPQNPTQIAGISLLAVEFMFPNARDVINKTNELTAAIGG